MTMTGFDALPTETDSLLLRLSAPLGLLQPFGGADIMSGATALTLVKGTSKANLLQGGSGADQISGLGGDDTLLGKGGNDTLDGGAGLDSMVGRTGDDLYYANSRHDVISEVAGEGTDTVIYSAAGGYFYLPDNVENMTFTGTHAAFMFGNSGNNVIIGGGASDYLNGMLGNDTLKGGAGDDTYVIDNAADKIVEGAGKGLDAVYLDADAYTLAANVDDAYILSDTGTALTGNGLGNYLIGFVGSDTIDGGDGSDLLAGGEGRDVLTGGAGGDIFVFDSAAVAGNVDTIMGYEQFSDIIYLSAAVYGLDPGPLGAGQFKVIGPTGSATDSDDRVLYDASTGKIYVDTDGSGATAAHLIAVLDNKWPLAEGDFLIT